MALRYALSSVLGNGSFASGFRAAAAELPGVDSANVITSGLQVALSVIGTRDLSALLELPGVLVLPDHPWETPLANLFADEWQELVEGLEAVDLDGIGDRLQVPAGLREGGTYGALLQCIGEQFDPGFELGNFGVGDPDGS